MRKVEAWMDSTDFDHELGTGGCECKIHSSKEVCEFKHPCIEARERCYARRVYVFDAAEFDRAGKKADVVRFGWIDESDFYNELGSETNPGAYKVFTLKADCDESIAKFPKCRSLRVKVTPANARARPSAKETLAKILALINDPEFRGRKKPI